MDTSRKLRMFKALVGMGFKEIEIGFLLYQKQISSFADNFIDNNLIPEDVTVQVLTQAREHLIDKTFEALSDVSLQYYTFITQFQHYNEESYLIRIERCKKNSIDGAQMVFDRLTNYKRQTPTTVFTGKFYRN